jgi:hypothetical protein
MAGNPVRSAALRLAAARTTQMAAAGKANRIDLNSVAYDYGPARSLPAIGDSCFYTPIWTPTSS